MSQNAVKNRVIFIDLLRAFAVLNMVQGHTVDVLLANEFRNPDSLIFGAWVFNRGMTAPLFLFSAGMTFTYLFRLQPAGFKENPRFYKGFKRFLLLVFLGYLIKLPTGNPLYIEFVTEAKWNLFFAADVLQIIGFGILFLMMWLYIAERIKWNDIPVLTAATFFVIILAPLILAFPWHNYMHLSIANYLNRDNGSLFTIFPWVAYIFAGGIFGAYLAHAGKLRDERKLGKIMLGTGIALVIFSVLNNLLEIKMVGTSTFWANSPNLVLLRLGLVLLLTALIIYISLKINSVPNIVVLLGRNTLLIYVVHLVILYGSPWSAGLSKFVGYSFNPFQTILSALIMIGLMSLMVIIFNKLNFKNRQLVTS